MKVEDIPTGELIRQMVEDQSSAIASIVGQLDGIQQLISWYVSTIRAGGKVVYFGAGTSGRIGFMDAAELYPTFGVGSEFVVALIAGGTIALQRSVEGAEDDVNAANSDFRSLDPKANFLFIGLSATGRTPYVLQILRNAKEIGARTAAITCTPGSPVAREADLAIVVDTGEEMVKGSTRLKAGTVEKVVLNTVSTISMMKLGKTREGLMVSMIPLNSKLRDRAVDIVVKLTGCSRSEAEETLEGNNWNIEETLKKLEGRAKSNHET
ncbi:MAG: N-acetylmuramic acid 6-phosphate etherase [Thermoprotei archaeon]